MKLLWTEADGYARYCIAVTVGLVIASAAVTGLSPLFLKILIDALERQATLLSLLHIVSMYALSLWLSRALGELRSMYFGRSDQRLQRNLSHKLFEHVMALPLRFHLEGTTGALGQALTNGLVGCRMVLHHLMTSLLPVVVELCAMCTVLLLLGQATFLVIIAISALIYMGVFWAGIKGIVKPARAASSAHISAFAFFTDAVLNYETVKCFGAERQVQERFEQEVAGTEAHWRELLMRKLQSGLAASVVFVIALAVSVYVAARAVLKNEMSIGEFVLVNTYMLQITRPLETIGFALRDVAHGMGFVDKMLKLFQEEREVEEGRNCPSLTARAPELFFENVSYSYQTERYVLRNVTFNVPAGRTLGVVGRSGSGKSSIIRLLLRLVEPTAGQIWLDGRPLSTVLPAVLRQSIAVVPQDIVLFNESIAYNIAFGSETSSETEIVRAAKLAHIHEFIAGLPNGYETRVGERGLKLSGGEKQRVAIARAVIKKPRIFLFDEATSSLDSEAERAILGSLLRVSEATTTLIIAHRLSTVVHADAIVVLDEGSVVEHGTHRDLLQRSSVYAAMWATQSGIHRTAAVTG